MSKFDASGFRSALAAGEKELSGIRARIADAEDRRADLLELPCDRAEVERRVDAAIASSIAEGVIDLGQDDPHVTGLRKPVFTSLFSGHSGLFSLCAIVAPAGLRAALLSGVRPGGISAKDRAAGLAKVAAELEELAIAEEKLIRELETATGGTLPRRPDADPALRLAPDAELVA